MTQEEIDDVKTAADDIYMLAEAMKRCAHDDDWHSVQGYANLISPKSGVIAYKAMQLKIADAGTIEA